MSLWFDQVDFSHARQQISTSAKWLRRTVLKQNILKKIESLNISNKINNKSHWTDTEILFNYGLFFVLAQI